MEMNVDQFSATVVAMIDKRQADIAISKRVLFLGRTECQKSILLRSCVLLIYASLEGGVKELCRHYLSAINLKKPGVQELHPAYLYLASRRTCRTDQQILDHDKAVALVNEIREFMMAPVSMPTSMDTESNLSPKVVARICRSLCLNEFMNNDQEAGLNQLLRFRNNIAHGDQQMPVDGTRIDQFSGIAQYILAQFAGSICEAYHGRVWLIGSP